MFCIFVRHGETIAFLRCRLTSILETTRGHCRRSHYEVKQEPHIESGMLEQNEGRRKQKGEGRGGGRTGGGSGRNEANLSREETRW